MPGDLPRKDQRAAGELYARGLLTDGQRKSMQPMAARLGTDHQRLQQFITSSTWDYAAVRRNVARDFAGSRPVEALVADDTGFPKDGTASPCVARQYCGTLGKKANCQVGVSVHLVSERARIPGEVRHTGKWRLALEMIDEMTGPGGWGILEQATAGARPAVAADAGYGDATAFRLGLENRGWQYVVAVQPAASAHVGDARPVTPPRGAGPGRPARPGYPRPPANLRTLAIASADQVRPVTWRQGTRATAGNPDASMTSCFLAIRVRPANRDIPRAGDGSLPECRLPAEWPPEAGEPADYWLSNLSPDIPITELVRLAKIRWRIEMVFSQLTKGPMWASGGGWQDVADLNLVVGDDYPVDEQFGQLPSLRERGRGKPGPDALAECLDAVGDGLQLQALFSGGVQLALLSRQRGLAAVQFRLVCARVRPAR